MAHTLYKLVLSLFAALVLWTGLSPVQAQDRAREVRTVLEQRDRQIKAVLGNKTALTAAERAQLKEVINDGIDFEAMARQALGSHWGTLSAQQRAEFVDVFSGIVRAQSLSNLDVYRARVTYGDVKVSGNTARAATTAIYKEVPTKVEYVLALEGGAWRVQDIVLDGVSTADGYARSFQSVIRKRGYDALMQSLRKKLASVEQ